MHSFLRARVARVIALATLAIAFFACAGAATAATVNGGSASGFAGQQVSVTFTLNGNGVTQAIGAVYNLPPELSFVGAPTGASPPFQCTSGGIAWTSTGSPIPSNAGTCTYQVLISAGATPGVKQITLTQASCDNVCTFNPAQITVLPPNVPPSLNYSPTSGSLVTLGGGSTVAGSTATANITATATGGSGSGAAATTTVTACGYGGPGAGAFGAPPPSLSFTGAAGGSQSLALSCTRTTATENATLTCTETAGAGGGVQRSWPVACPTGSPANIPPALAYLPTPGTPVNFGGGSGLEGSLASAAISIQPSGGAGSGTSATTTVSACAVSGVNAAQFGGPPESPSFVGASTLSQSLTLSCTRAATQLSATLSCTQTAGGAGGVSRSWPLSCPPGGSVTPSTVSLAVTPNRIVGSASVTVEWFPVNATNCVPSSDGQGTTLVSSGTNRATASVTAGANARNETFTVTCVGSQGSISNTAVLSVGIPPAPPPTAIEVVAASFNNTPVNGASRNVALSEDGRFVAFESSASNLVAGDTNGTPDVFVRDTDTGQTRRASVATGGAQLGDVSADARITGDGRTVLFTRGIGIAAASTSSAKTVVNGQVCLNNLATNLTECISKNPNGTPGNGSSNNGDLSADGNVIVYESTSTNIAPEDTNGAISDVFAYTKSTNTVRVLSLDANNQSSNAASTTPAISCNGRHTTFESRASLVNGAATQGGVRNIYAILQTGPKRLVTTGLGGAAANGDSGRPRVSNDGRLVFFESTASNLVASDTNGVRDVFVADLGAGTIRRLSASPLGVQGNGESSRPQIPCDAAYMSFESSASNLVANDTNGRADIFLVDLGTGVVTLGSRTPTGAPANGSSGNGELSPDGTVFGFDSDAGNLGGGDQTTVFAGTNPFAVQNYTGAWYDPAQAGHGLFLDQLPDGRLVAWWFTFDPAGQQAWFGGVGQIQGTNAVVSVVRTQGARFLPNFVAADAVNNPIGTLTFNFSACDRGRVDFRLDSTFGNGFMNLARLTTPLGVTCGSAAAAPKAVLAASVAPPGSQGRKAVEPTVGPIAGVTGAWYDPTQAGHGLFVENLGERRLLMWWFTFGPSGGQAWFGGVADIVNGNTAQMNFVRTQGGRWIPNFNPANVSNPVLGTATVRFDNCDSGRIDYTLQQGYGTGTMILRPLLRPIGAVCTD